MGNTKSFNTVITPITQTSFFKDARELWKYREVFIGLALRDSKARYRQSILGVFWFVLQPIITTLVFTIVFGRFARVDSGDIPYPIFVFSGLLLWQFLSRNLESGSYSLVTYRDFINKVYFPRMGVPFISLLMSTIDFIIALVVLFVLMLFYEVAFQWQLIFVPIILLVSFFVCYGSVLILSPLNALYRDIEPLVKHGVQILMYLSPVIYPVSFLSEEYQELFDYSPIATLLSWMRWALIGTPLPNMKAFIVLVVAIFVILVVGRAIFRKLEPKVVDKI